MKKFCSIVLVVTMILTFIPNALALEHFIYFENEEEMANTTMKFSINKDGITSEKITIENKIDNSNLLVKVIQPTASGETKEVYRGLMSGLKDGPWQYVDYSKLWGFAVLIKNTDTIDVLYIIPVSDDEESELQNAKNTSVNPTTVEYTIAYEITNENDISILTSQFNITNLLQVASEAVIIAGLYKNGKLEGMVNKKITFQPGASLTEELELTLPEENTDEYSVKLMVWDSFLSLIPLGESVTICSLSIYENVEPIDISATENTSLYKALKKARPMLDYDNDGIITVSELSTLTGSIDLSHRNIRNINGLQGLSNVTEIYLCDNKIENANFLAPLTTLKMLDLRNNNISSLEAVPKNISSLHVENNLITNLNVLRNCTQLSYLFCDNNQIENLDFASEMSQLHTISITNNCLSDISGISSNTALKYFNFSDNNVSDISALNNKIFLEDIRFSNNNVSDISHLPNKRFRNAYINGNGLTAEQKNSVNAIVKKS